MPSLSVREGRKLQEQLDWPLSARGKEETKQAKKVERQVNAHRLINVEVASPEWSWDNDIAGSNIS